MFQWAESMGPHVLNPAKAIMASKPHPQQGLQSCRGLVKLAKEYSADRLEAGCQRALAIQALSYKSLKSILKNGLEKLPWPEPQPVSPTLPHPHIRGAQYCN